MRTARPDGLHGMSEPRSTVRALPAGELADLLDALLAAGGDDVGRAELAAELRALSPRRGMIAVHE